jgi:asparagine synthetase B (glutamine-hydrolysing)
MRFWRLYTLEMHFCRRVPKETIERVQKLFTADLLRADKSTMAHGLEARVPF